MNSFCRKQFLFTWRLLVSAARIPSGPFDDLTVHISARTFSWSSLIVRNQFVISCYCMCRNAVRYQKSHAFKLFLWRMITIVVAHETNSHRWICVNICDIPATSNVNVTIIRYLISWKDYNSSRFSVLTARTYIKICGQIIIMFFGNGRILQCSHFYWTIVQIIAWSRLNADMCDENIWNWMFQW